MSGKGPCNPQGWPTRREVTLLRLIAPCCLLRPKQLAGGNHCLLTKQQLLTARGTARGTPAMACSARDISFRTYRFKYTRFLQGL